MDKLLHTPGPWEVANAIADNSGTYGAMVFSVYANNGTHIYDKRILNKYIEEHKANARLIAAAPDLLDAVLLAYFKLTSSGVGIDDYTEKILSNAIKKATT